MCCVMATCWSWFDVQCHGKLLLGMSSPFKLCARVCHLLLCGLHVHVCCVCVEGNVHDGRLANDVWHSCNWSIACFMMRVVHTSNL